MLMAASLLMAAAAFSFDSARAPRDDPGLYQSRHLMDLEHRRRECGVLAKRYAAPRFLCDGVRDNKDLVTELLASWKRRQQILFPVVISGLERGDTGALYQTQEELQVLFYAASMYGWDAILEDIVARMNELSRYLHETSVLVIPYSTGRERNVRVRLDPPVEVWVNRSGRETLLHSIQFLYFAAQIVNTLSEKQSAQGAFEKDVFSEFMKIYPDVLVSHYTRWILGDVGFFQRIGNGCGTTRQNHRAHVELLTERRFDPERSYCNRVGDSDLMLIAGTAELLTALHRNPALAAVSTAELNELENHLAAGIELIRSRVSRQALETASDRQTVAASFDRGHNDDHHTHRFAGYRAGTFPGPEQTRPAANVGWDMQHAGRFFYVLDSVNRACRAIAVPCLDELTRQLGRSLFYRAFNRDFDEPRVTTFFDGHDGWFRVGYNDRAGYGLGPGAGAYLYVRKGYGLWWIYLEEFKLLNLALDRLAGRSTPSTKNFYSLHRQFEPVYRDLDAITRGTRTYMNLKLALIY